MLYCFRLHFVFLFNCFWRNNIYFRKQCVSLVEICLYSCRLKQCILISNYKWNKGNLWFLYRISSRGQGQDLWQFWSSAATGSCKWTMFNAISSTRTLQCWELLYDWWKDWHLGKFRLHYFKWENLIKQVSPQLKCVWLTVQAKGSLITKDIAHPWVVNGGYSRCWQTERGGSPD